MKKLLLALVVAFIIQGCRKNDPYENISKNVVSDEKSIDFRELLLLVNVKANDSLYLVVKSIDSLNLFVNNNFWAKASSLPMDTTKIQKGQYGNMFASNQKVNYFVLASQEVESPDLLTAGEVSKYLNSYFDLSPGDYACFIESFSITFNDNTTKKYYPMHYVFFKVEEKMQSAYVGEIELKLQ